jgi:hypothetical protein
MNDPEFCADIIEAGAHQDHVPEAWYGSIDHWRLAYSQMAAENADLKRRVEELEWSVGAALAERPPPR